MSKFEKGNLSLMMYRTSPPPAEQEADIAAWISSRLSVNPLPMGKPGMGWSNQYAGHVDFDEHVELNEDAFRFMYAKAEVSLPSPQQISIWMNP